MKPNRTIGRLDQLARLMDSRFCIPGTHIRFGLDAVIGLVPGLGDFSTFIISGAMVLVLASNGASGYVLARMVLNIVIDALAGSVPLVGDVFDIAFKANIRNMKLMHAHYKEGRHQGSALKLIIPLVILLLILLAGILWLTWRLISWLFHIL